MGTVEKFYINREISNGNQPNDKHTITVNISFESILRGEGCMT